MDSDPNTFLHQFSLTFDKCSFAVSRLWKAIDSPWFALWDFSRRPLIASAHNNQSTIVGSICRFYGSLPTKFCTSLCAASDVNSFHLHIFHGQFSFTTCGKYFLVFWFYCDLNYWLIRGSDPSFRSHRTAAINFLVMNETESTINEHYQSQAAVTVFAVIWN